jgi:hypothetical protein
VAECRKDRRKLQRYESRMHHAIMLTLAIVWVAGNFYLWSMKQSHLTLFCQSFGMAIIAYPALYFYVTRRK